jgi:predicted dehydrogenase
MKWKSPPAEFRLRPPEDGTNLKSEWNVSPQRMTDYSFLVWFWHREKPNFSQRRETWGTPNLIAELGHADGNPQIGVGKPAVTSEEPLHAELRSFLRAVRERSAPVVPLGDGRRALALALDIVEEIREHGKKAGLSGLAKT